jgi:hypothetical protein
VRRHYILVEVRCPDDMPLRTQKFEVGRLRRAIHEAAEANNINQADAPFYEDELPTYVPVRAWNRLHDIYVEINAWAKSWRESPAGKAEAARRASRSEHRSDEE